MINAILKTQNFIIKLTDRYLNANFVFKVKYLILVNNLIFGDGDNKKIHVSERNNKSNDKTNPPTRT